MCDAFHAPPECAQKRGGLCKPYDKPKEAQALLMRTRKPAGTSGSGDVCAPQLSNADRKQSASHSPRARLGKHASVMSLPPPPDPVVGGAAGLGVSSGRYAAMMSCCKFSLNHSAACKADSSHSVALNSCQTLITKVHFYLSVCLSLF